MPGRLEFSTTADGAASVTERMRIDSSGRVGIGVQHRLHGFFIPQQVVMTTAFLPPVVLVTLT